MGGRERENWFYEIEKFNKKYNFYFFVFLWTILEIFFYYSVLSLSAEFFLLIHI